MGKPRLDLAAEVVFELIEQIDFESLSDDVRKRLDEALEPLFGSFREADRLRRELTDGRGHLPKLSEVVDGKLPFVSPNGVRVTRLPERLPRGWHSDAGPDDGCTSREPGSWPVFVRHHWARAKSGDLAADEAAVHAWFAANPNWWRV